MENVADSYLEKAYEDLEHGYTGSKVYSDFSSAYYEKIQLEIQRQILEEEKAQTELLKKIEENTRK